jgi:hypothetical protein
MTIADEIKEQQAIIRNAQSQIYFTERKIKEIQGRCPHKNTEKDIDPSGSNRTSYTCLDCGADV